MAAASAGCAGGSFDAPPGLTSGEGTIELKPAVVEASEEIRLRISWTAGPSGLLAGGGFSVRFPVAPGSPSPGFTPPHHRARHVPGFVQCWARRGELLTGEADTVAISSDGGVEARCTLRSGALRPGDGLALDYWGLAPRIAGRYDLGGASRLWGARGAAPLPRPAALEVKGKPARVLSVLLPTSARPGETVSASLRVLDEFGNRAEGFDGAVELTLGAQSRLARFSPVDRGTAQVDGLVAPAEGVVRAEAVETGQMRDEYRLGALSNPMRVLADAPRVQWGDLCFSSGMLDAEDVMPLGFAFAIEPLPGRLYKTYSSRTRSAEREEHLRFIEPDAGWLRAAGSPPAAFIACSDNDWGRPGTIRVTGLEPGAGGLTAVLEESDDRERILDALERGRAWATTGARMILMARRDGSGIHLFAAGEKPLRGVTMVLLGERNRKEIPVDAAPAMEIEVIVPVPREETAAALWFRAEQEDGQIAWSAPMPLGGGRP